MNKIKNEIIDAKINRINSQQENDQIRNLHEQMIFSTMTQLIILLKDIPNGNELFTKATLKAEESLLEWFKYNGENENIIIDYPKELHQQVEEFEDYAYRLRITV